MKWLCPIILCSLLFALPLQADTLTLPEITIFDKNTLIHSFGRNVTDKDTTFNDFLNLGLNAYIESSGMGYLKSYGPGNSSIFSNQGTGAQHNQVVWNGIPTNNGLLGLSDISLLSIGEMNDIKIIQGTTASYWGGGAIGSTLILNTRFTQKQKYTVSASFNSLNNKSIELSFSKSIKKILLFGKVCSGFGENKFKVLDYTSPSKNIRAFDSPFDSKLAELSLHKSFGNQSVQFHLFFADFKRQLSNSLTEVDKTSDQKDRIFRSVVQYDKHLKRTRITGLAGYTYNRINFKNDVVNDTGSIHVLLTKLEAEHNFRFLQVYQTFQSKFEFAENSSYSKTVSRNISSFINGISLLILKNIKVNFESRAEMIDGNSIILIAGGGLEGRYKKLMLKSYISGSFNNPTLNDLYWVPGGNNSLTPERGINAGATIAQDWTLGGLQNMTLIEGFYHNINDWIQWVPNGNIWSPVNYKQVISSGLNFKQKVSAKFKEHRFDLDFLFSLTRSLNKSRTPVASFNKQLAYIPFVTGTTGLNYHFKEIFVGRIEMSAVGNRFSVFDESEFLSSYGLVNVSFGLKIGKGAYEFLPFIQINNVFNQYYESVAFRPREPRNFLIGIKLNIL